MRLALSIRRTPLAPVAPLVALLLAVACGDKSTESGPPPLSRLTILQSTLDTLSELATRQLTLSGFDAKGGVVTAPNVSWQSSDTSVVTVSAAGLVTARQPGSATLTARSGAVSVDLSLRIVAIPVRDLTLRLVGAVSADTLLVGTTATVIGEARDETGRALLGRRITLTVAEGGGGTGTLDSLGRVTGRAVGALQLVARLDTVERLRRVIVRPPFAAGLSVRLLDPKALRDTLWIGLKDSAIVAFADSAGAALAPTPFRPVSFSSDNPGVAGIDPEGRVIPVGAGTVTLRAAGDRLVAARTLRVVAAPITSVLAAPDTVRLMIGETTQLRPLLLDGAGLRVSSLGTRTLRYESSNPGLATVDPQGVARGVALGTTSLRLTGDRGTATVPVRILSPAGDRAFKIAVRFVGPTPATEVADAFAAATRRWESVIRETNAAGAIELRQGRCGNTAETQIETASDVVIFAQIDSIDGPGSILGQAGPCIIRQLVSGRWLPVIGQMAFDSADMRTMAASGRLQNVIAHEIGHVLGIGTLWASRFQPTAALAVQQPANDPRYTGAGGMLASAGMGFTNFSLGETGSFLLDRVPLENTGGSGTAGAHWRRSTFGNELMNGFAGAGVSPLSLLTVQAMADLGYSTSTASVEPWGQFFGPTPASLALGRIFDGGAIQIGERLVEPTWEVDAGGRTRRLPGIPARAQ